MMLNYRKADLKDLPFIIELLTDDALGRTREHANSQSIGEYTKAFHRIDSDPNHYLVVGETSEKIVATCHLTLLPSLTFTGCIRLQIEAVRVHSDLRGQNIGHDMIAYSLEWGKAQGAKIFQLTTNKQRSQALEFYKKIGFQATHEGMKLYML